VKPKLTTKQSLFLNRTQVYASTRRPLRFGPQIRFTVRLIPIILFTYQILNLLQAIKCQTSPDHSTIRYGKPGKNLTLDYASDGGFLYWLSSNILFWQNDEGCCEAVNMTRRGKNTYGSLSLLWPVFQSLCVSHFVETLSCALQGMPVRTETGMSIFEHSLAFAEVETMVSNSVGLGLFGLPRPNPTLSTSSSKATSGATELLSRAYVLDRLNVPPEVLLIALISCCNSLTSNFLGVLGWQNRFRLVNTTIWGICFMAAFTWGFFNITEGNTGIFRFPTVCIVGFIPHLLILIGIFICAFIYFLAMIISALALPEDLPRPTSLKQRFAMAHENLQGNVQIKGIRLDMHQDFYSALLKIGFTALTAASEAVFLNEGRSVEVRRFTWLEEDRLDEIEAASKANPLAQQTSSSAGAVQIEDSAIDQYKKTDQWESGYAKERTTQILKDGRKTVHSHIGPGGVGALQRSSRHYLMFTFLTGIFWLLVGWSAIVLDKMLDRIRIKRRPQWFRKFVGRGEEMGGAEETRSSTLQQTLDFWLLTDEGRLELPDDDNVDVEAETKKRIRMESNDSPSEQWNDQDEQTLDSRLYDWWKHGGWWGAKDESGGYTPSNTDDDEDTTSVISVSDTNTEAEWESEPEGQRTPTQADTPFYPVRFRHTRSPSPSIDDTINLQHIAKLLNPKDPETRQEALILSSHLASDESSGIMTRSRFRKAQDSERAKILTTTRYGRSGRQSTTSSSNTKGQKPTPEEEAEILEFLILSRRSGVFTQTENSNPSAEPTSPSSEWQTGASGLGSSGPQCVVCQGAPRTIIAWPCRCLCLCEECRVSLAMNNFGSCVTCRRDVGGFVRLYVP
jgi:hypothetical protein